MARNSRARSRSGMRARFRCARSAVMTCQRGVELIERIVLAAADFFAAFANGFELRLGGRVGDSRETHDEQTLARAEDLGEVRRLGRQRAAMRAAGYVHQAAAVVGYQDLSAGLRERAAPPRPGANCRGRGAALRSVVSQLLVEAQSISRLGQSLATPLASRRSRTIRFITSSRSPRV